MCLIQILFQICQFTYHLLFHWLTSLWQVMVTLSTCLFIDMDGKYIGLYCYLISFYLSKVNIKFSGNICSVLPSPRPTRRRAAPRHTLALGLATRPISLLPWRWHRRFTLNRVIVWLHLLLQVTPGKFDST